MATATLTPKQTLFVAECLVDGNGKQAAIRAGCSPRSAEVTASKWLRLAKVKTAVATGREQRLIRVKRSADEVVLALENIGYLDTTAIWNADRSMKHPMDWPLDLRLCVKRYRVIKRNAEAGDGHTDTMWDVEFWSKPDALRMLGMHHGMFTEKHEHTHLLTIGVRLDAGRANMRAKKLAQEAGQQPAVIDVQAEPAVPEHCPARQTR